MNINPYGYNYYQPQQQIQQPVYQPQQYSYQQQIPQQSNIQTQQIGLNGKIVDGIDTVKIQEVPIGGYGIYPKADLSTIYVKEWLNDGTTKIIIYNPVMDNNIPTKDKNNYENKLDDIYSSINQLSEKLDSFLS